MNNPDRTISLGQFSPPEADPILQKLIENGITPKIEVDNGIDKVDVRFGSSGTMAKITIFVPPHLLEKALTLLP
jgi:hypothetical protein